MASTILQSHTTFQEFAAALHGHREPVALVSHLLSGLQALIPTDYNSWKEITVQGRPQVAAVFSPHNPTAASLLPMFQRHFGLHPICNYWRRSGKHSGALSWADVASKSEFETLALYKEFYGPLSVHHQLIVALEARPSHLIYIALNRNRTPFTEQERYLLTALQPHASQALQQTRELHRLRSTLASFETLVNHMNQGIMCLSARNRISWASTRTRSFLHRYWRSAPDTVCLPDMLLAWLLKSLKDAGTVGVSREPLIVQNQTSRLVVRLLVEKKERYLFFEETTMQRTFEQFKQFGLTDREAEVLGWVAQGKSNDETASILNVCSQTVKKHLERIYAALNVTNRTEAALKAHDMVHPQP
ncbi:MAG: helix-turn-helix transcriptional regulator [Nitrospira sp.]|nr:MAG: helix-turn-helix transcriptional regulator [Nitrospira sp.]